MECKNRIATPYYGGNSLLDSLIAAESQSILDDAEVKSYGSGTILLDSNETIAHVFFPIDMMISTTTLMRDGGEIEVGTIGCEGMAGAQIVLGIDHVPGKTGIQVAGTGVSLPAQSFLHSVERSARAHKIMQRYLQAQMNFLEIAIACNALHESSARCARWLLISYDRVQRKHFGLTQEFLAGMLGVRRATVNGIAQELQGQGAIRYSRGQVEIVDRERLERASCECYKVGIQRYEELLGQAPFRRRDNSADASWPV